MRLLYHLWLSPLSRKIRLVLHEKNLDFSMQVEKVWERRPEFVALNPACEVPVLVEPDGTVVAEATAIAEYLDETEREKLLLGLNPPDRAEVRRLVAWFLGKLDSEVTSYLLAEKIYKRHLVANEGGGPPDAAAIRAARSNIRYHMRYIGYRMARRNWLSGKDLSFADLAAAAELA